MAKIALVTGAASGMGRLFALRMAVQGYKVAALDRDSNGLEKMVLQSDNIIPFVADVTDATEIKEIADQLVKEFGHIDRLVTCAAIMPTGMVSEMDAETVNRVMAINYGGTINAVRAVLDRMRLRDEGEIIIFGSTAGSVLMTECAAYCASKAATNSYAEILMEENRNNNLQFMLVCPPLVGTPLLQQAVATSNPAIIDYSLGRDRFVSPEFVIDQVERGLARGVNILKPGFEAKWVMLLRRISPRALWSVLHWSSKSDQ